MRNPKIRSILPVAVILSAIICTSCLERRETITVDETGRTTIRAEFSGPEDSFAGPLAVPSEPEWTIISRTVDSSGRDVRLEIKAEKVVPYGKPLPETFATGEPASGADLRFPTEVRYWTEGNHTYYEFKRTYLSLPFGGVNMTESALWDQELEDRVLEQGIFNVSEGDRNRYLDQFSSSFGYLHWRLAWAALGEMVRQGDIAASVMSTVNQRTFEHTDAVVTPVRILGILGKEEDSIGPALDNLETELHDSFFKIFSDVVGPENETLRKKYADVVDSIILDYNVAERLEGHEISVTVNLPGTIIDCNGMVDPEEPGSVAWLLVGADLRRADFPLYALSIVEK